MRLACQTMLLRRPSSPIDLLFSNKCHWSNPTACTSTKGHEFDNFSERLYGHHNHTFSFIPICMGVENRFTFQMAVIGFVVFKQFKMKNCKCTKNDEHTRSRAISLLSNCKYDYKLFRKSRVYWRQYHISYDNLWIVKCVKKFLKISKGKSLSMR